LEEKREDLLATCVKEIYLVPERPSKAALIREIRRRFAEQQLPVPNYRTVARRVAALDPRFTMAKRQGTKAARQKFGPVGVSNLRPEAPLELLQIDHTLVDVIVVDREHRLAIGRPWLTLAIDITTRSVVGFSVSLEAPSSLSVSLVLTHAVLPKAIWLADRELQNLDWPMAGLPQMIHVDNAKEFHSEALLRGCQEYGIMIDHRPRGQPQVGGHIERLIGTMMGAVHLLPGTTFSNPIEKKSYESEDRAVLTLAELERWLALQIAGVYHLSVHSALGETPLSAWQKGMARGGHPMRHPASPQEFFLNFLPAEPGANPQPKLGAARMWRRWRPKTSVIAESLSLCLSTAQVQQLLSAFRSRARHNSPQVKCSICCTKSTSGVQEIGDFPLVKYSATPGFRIGHCIYGSGSPRRWDAWALAGLRPKLPDRICNSYF